MDSTTSHDTAYFVRRPQQSRRINRWTEPKQPPRSNYRPTQSQQSSSSKHGHDYYQTHRITTATQNPPYAKTIPGASLALTDATAHIVTHLLLRLRLRPMSQQRMRVHQPQTSRYRIFGTNKTKCDGSSSVLPH